MRISSSGRRRAGPVAPRRQELVITPQAALQAGLPFTVRVEYAGQADRVDRPRRRRSGLGDHRRRRVRGQRAAGLAGLVPGERPPARQGDVRHRDHRARGRSRRSRTACWSRRRDRGGRTTWRWPRTRRWRRTSRRRRTASSSCAVSTAGRHPALARDRPAEAADAGVTGFAPRPEIIAFFSGLFGPYPFERGGGIVDDAPEVGYALETQTKAHLRPDAGHVDRGARAGAPVVRQQRDA